MRRLQLPPTTNWGRILRELREDRGLSQRSAAKAVGINRTTLRRLEGGRTFDIRKIEQFIRAYGYKLDALKVSAREVA